MPVGRRPGTWTGSRRTTTSLHGVRQFHGCYCVGDDTLWGVVRRRQSAANTLAALKSIRKALPVKLRETAEATGSRVSASWNDVQKSWAQHVVKLRQDIDAKKAELDAKRADRHARHAEEDALFAIDYAYAAIEEADYAVLYAISARMEADELALK